MNLSTILLLCENKKIDFEDIPLFFDDEDTFDYKILINFLEKQNCYNAFLTIRHIFEWLAIKQPEKCQKLIIDKFLENPASIFNYDIFRNISIMGDQLNQFKNIIYTKVKKAFPEKEVVFIDISNYSIENLFESITFNDYVTQKRLRTLFEGIANERFYIVCNHTECCLKFYKNEERKKGLLFITLRFEDFINIFVRNIRWEQRTGDFIQIIGKENYEKVCRLKDPRINTETFFEKLKGV